jgi:glutamate-5-semialdehyde dehydrogenase
VTTSFSGSEAVKKALRRAREASSASARASTAVKNRTLDAVAAGLLRSKTSVLRANARDLRRAEREGLGAAKVDRLRITPARLEAMADGVRTVAKLSDPIGTVQRRWKRPNGLRLSKVTVPIGVVLIIYESRPNVTVECGALCLKSGNAVLLRGGKEAFDSNLALTSVFESALRKNALPPACVQSLRTTDRAAVDFLLEREDEIQLVIPRGGEALIRKVARSARMPVIKHYKGVCHVYVDGKADLGKAEAIALNAKLQRPGVCNAMETLLVDKRIARAFLPRVGKKLVAGGCEIRADAAARRLIPGAKAAKASDFGFEFLDRVLAVRVVDGVDGAVAHIGKNGSGHTEAIVTKDRKAARRFAERVDASSVMINASTRFADGFEYGFGAEIGISTDKIHARGPMGLEGLTSYKYLVEGSGQIRA